MNERRTQTRKPLSFLVQHEVTGGMPVVDYATNLSLNGIFIHTKDKLNMGDTLHVQFAPHQDGRLVSAFCKVARVTEHGFGASFTALEAQAEKLVSEAVN
jgi:hypothetical protein